MTVFVILLLSPMLVQHIVLGKRNIDYEKKNRLALTLFFAILAILLVFRHNIVGSDTKNYIHYFNYFSKLDWVKIGNDTLEIGFSYYNKLVSVFTDEPQVFLGVTAIITLAMIYPTYRRLCVDPSLTIVLFATMSTFVMLFSGIRQMIAVGIGFLAYEFTRKKKFIPYLIFVILAIAFHTSAFMLAFMYPIYHVRITKKWLAFVIPVITITFLFNQQIFYALSFLIERFTSYDATIEHTGAYTIIVLFLLFTVFSFLIPEESQMDDETIGLRNFLLLSLVLQMFAPLHTIAMRMNYYYIIFIPLLIPKIIEFKNKRWEQLAIVGRHIMVVFFLVYFFISASDGGVLRVFPYHFCWENIG